MRFYLVDKVKELIPGEKAVGIKCWSLDNEIFQDHFPGFPTTPGVLLTESMAQLAGILIEYSYYKEFGEGNKVYPVLSIIQKAKFRKFVSPGDQCVIEAKLISVDRGHGSARIQTKVEGEMMCETTLNFLIGLESDLDNNPYIKKRGQYYHSILPKELR
jgi:3-hydroxyacyl-[acyl-carrier-protein] dehydratase